MQAWCIGGLILSALAAFVCWACVVQGARSERRK